MKAPTSQFGCFDLECISCHGDKEWQNSQLIEWANNVIFDPEGWSPDDVHEAELILEYGPEFGGDDD